MLLLFFLTHSFIYYPNTDWVGVMSRDTRGEVKFYAAIQDSFLSHEPDLLFSLTTNLSLTPVWNSANTDFFLTKLRHHDPEVIGLRSNTGLEFYQFNTNYTLDKIANTSQIIKPLHGNTAQDRLFFANFTHQIYQDILHLNNSGLYIYQYKIILNKTICLFIITLNLLNHMDGSRIIATLYN